MARRRGKRQREVRDALIDSPLRRFGLALLAAKVALVAVAFDPAALAAFTLPKALLGQALAAGLGAVLATLLVRHGRTSWILVPADRFVAALSLAFALATVFALDRYLAVFGSQDRLLGLLAVIDGVILYLALVQLPRTRDDARLVIAAALAGALIVLAYGLAQRLGLDPIDWSGDETVRSFGTIGNATTFGHYLAVVSAGALALGVREGAPLRERAALLALAVACYLSALASGTRAVLLAAPVLLAVAGVASIRFIRARGGLTARRGAGAAAALLLSLAAVTGLAYLAGGDRLAGLLSDPEGVLEGRSVGGRVVIYEVSLAAVRDRPLTGLGPDNFEVAYPEYRPERAFAETRRSVPETSAHSWLAKLATDAGLLGLAAFGALIAVLARATWRSGQGELALLGWALIASHLAIGLVTVSDVATQWLLWAGIAAVARGSAPAPEPAPQRGPVRREGTGSLLAPIAVLALLSLVSLPALGASRAAAESRTAAALGRSEAAVAAGREAVEADPYRAVYWHHLAIGYTRQQDFTQAARAFERAVELAPHHAVHRANLARAQLALGVRGDEAARARGLETARGAVALDPNSPEPRFALALAFAVNGFDAEAAAESERGRELDARPTEIGVYEIAARSYLRLSRPSDAERWARDGLRFARPSDEDAIQLRLYLAQALVGLGRPADALREIARVVAVDPDNAEAARIREEAERLQR